MEKQYVKNPTELLGVPVIPLSREHELILALSQKKSAARFEYGDSLSPMVRSGEYCILRPVSEADEIKVGDIVFCLVQTIDGQKFYMTHMVLNISSSGHDKTKWYQIGSSWGEIFGWSNKILAKAEGTNIFVAPMEEEYDQIAEK